MAGAARIFLLLGVFAGVANGAPTTRPVSSLPLVQLDVAEPITDTSQPPCAMKVGTGDVFKGVIRIRGSSSRAHPKKSYLVVLDTPAGLLGMPARRQWILNAAYIDRSLMRHKLAYDLFKSMGTPDRPRLAAGSRFVEVHLNGDYQGVYLLMERVDRELLGLAPFAAGDPAHACLYKAINHSAGFVRADHEGFEQEIPDPLVLAHPEPLAALMKFATTAPAAEFADPQKGIASRIDLDNAIDFHLLVLVTSNADGITKNFYLARHRPAGDAMPRFFFVPWDYDGTFGRNWDSSILPPTLWLSNGLFERLLRDPAYRERFTARWKQLRDNELSIQAIQKMIDVNAGEILAAAGRNAKRWPTDRRPFHDHITFEQDIEQMKAWVAQRTAWIDQAIERQTQPRGNRRR